MLNPSLAFGFDDVLIVPQYSTLKSRSEANVSTHIGKTTLKIPIISSNMDTITGSRMCSEVGKLGGMGLLHRYMPVEKQITIMGNWDGEAPFGVSVGTVSNDKKRIDLTLKKYYENKYDSFILCVDIAHGHSKHMIDTLKYIRDKCDYKGTLIAGAVCTPQGANALLSAGADAVRVGIGPGSACSTRVKTGCGYPQMSSILDCAKVGPIIADGGIRTPGDAAKALAAGAVAVMIGGMLAGTDWVPNWSPTSPTINYRGMASSDARIDFGQAGINSEGISCLVKTKKEGSAKKVIEEIVEGVRSAMSYSNSRTISEFASVANITRVTHSVINENTPHILNNI